MDTTTTITPEVLATHNLTQEEYARIRELMGREPTFVELGVFSVMWSEHCSYKSSRVHLKRLYTRNERVVVPPGENAGVVEVGDGWCAAFKVESHNHPSFIEPFQGAATGVGGILRDIFTMGARPVAAMNSIRFGTLDHAEHGRRNRALLAGVVAGIAHYGNAFGVATVGGEVMFDDAYAFNPLVNAFALGLVRRDQIFFGRAEGMDNPVLYVGAKTGRDGIHGATMASAEFDEEALEKRPTVQVGDPFLEKLLLEACLEAMRSGAVAGIQDMGAAGLTSSSCEMAARAGTGLELDLTLVPQRETGMTAYEIMLSESQERMLIVAHRGRERQVIDIFKNWDLDAVVIGRVTDTNRVQLIHHEGAVADIPVAFLTDEAPVYHRPMRAPEAETGGGRLNAEDAGGETERDEAKQVITEADESGDKSVAVNASVVNSDELQEILEAPSGVVSDASVAASGLTTDDGQLTTDNGRDHNESLLKILASPNVASKEWVYRQYDHMVRTNTAVLPGADAAIVRIKETRRALAMCLDGQGRYCAASPREGAKLIVAEAARNVVCVGARPIAVTNCLNFPSPERPEVMWAFSETIDGMNEACRAFDTPVISGNVSFYNETPDGAIYPTPTVGMVGVFDDGVVPLGQSFQSDGDLIYLLRPQDWENETGIGGSEYLSVIHGRDEGTPPRLDLQAEAAVQSVVRAAIAAGVLQSAHDSAEGGAAVALAESCLAGNKGAEVRFSVTDFAAEQGDQPWSAILFGEATARIIVSVKPGPDQEKLLDLAEEAGIEAVFIGQVKDNNRFDAAGLLDLPLAALHDAYENAIPRAMGEK